MTGDDIPCMMRRDLDKATLAEAERNGRIG